MRNPSEFLVITPRSPLVQAVKLAKLGLTLALTFGANAAAAAEPEAVRVLDWSSVAGIERLERSRHKVDFFALANHFESQTNRAFCGPTAATIVLNALRVSDPNRPKPIDRSLLLEEDWKLMPPGVSPLFSRYTQNTFFSTETEQVKSRAQVLGEPIEERRDGGLQLRQLHDMLEKLDLDVQLRVVDDALSVAEIRSELVANLGRRDDYVIINYNRRVLGQPGGGHISPLGAYDELSDSFLVLDVNPNRAPWGWIRTGDLAAAMRTFDRVENRGYLLVRDRPLAPSSKPARDG